MKIDKNIIDLIRKKNILIGVSGGVDSIVLFDLINKIKDEINLNIEIAHFNHSTRNGESDDDELFVKKICEINSIKFHSRRDSMSKYAKNNKISEEEAGRILRHKFFCDILKDKDDLENWYLALAHNLDDQIETIFMRIFRGTGIKGLEGMHQIDGKIIRPLLNFKKEEILEYAKKNKLEYHQDYTNFENIYTRNSIRNELIPIIKEKYSKNIYDSILNLSKYSIEYNEYINNKLNEKLNGLDIEISQDYTKIKKTDIHKFTSFERNIFLRNEIDRINNSNYDFTKNHYSEIGKIIDSDKGVYVIINGMIFYNSFNYFIIRRYDDFNESVDFEVKEDIIDFGKYKIFFNKNCDKPGLLKLNSGDKIKIRFRKNGDKICINGKIKKLKDFLIDKKIDRFERDLLPVIEYNGEIVMVSNLYKRKIKDNGKITIQIKEK
ncbi:tRNA lysidine(34) synthetase TilS [Helcococcus ovis]|uniref:tRNA(Ile)-lysidine synthase n=4 Tax=Helcococcus ovis TaxID=72026 RepID=A0A4R9C3V0_9FIRM|nr:tRNA lysidine(34) synthetase TilS [Helcococcus ovis]TFF64336.1 tRNA lysidine(34) synthetase TilS [Helcococcus ovis]TFF66470.1 tRNA lysidine(34) synthetase TilS [Helcococcus ovis]